MALVVTEHRGRTFDWAPRFDPRSLNFRAAPRQTEMPTTGWIWKIGPVLDQGAEGACVGMGCAGAVAAAPSSRAGVAFPYALSWYRRAQRLDEWQGEAYSGTSVNAGAKVGRERKLWPSWRWAKSPAELAAGILDEGLGPAVIGVQWSEDLYDVPASGLLPGDVDLADNMGHCVLIFGYLPHDNDITQRQWDQLEALGLEGAVRSLGGEPCFLLLNSWGRAWGRGGMAVVPLSLMRRWFAARGEFALPENRAKGQTAMTSAEEIPSRDEEQPATPVAEEAPEESDDGDRAGDVTLHITAAEVQEGDRILDPPEELGRESVTVRSAPRLVSSGGSGRRVLLAVRSGGFVLGAGVPVTVRRRQQ